MNGAYRRRQCKTCHKARHNETHKASTKKWQMANRERRKAHRRKWATGWTDEQFHAAWASQRGICGICSRSMTLETHKGNTAMRDHDHATGKTRELLCTLCNFGLGYFKDDPARLAEAIAYLARHQQ